MVYPIRVAVVGATGSVGGAVLDICSRYPEFFKVTALAAQSNEKKILELAAVCGAKTICLTNPVSKTFKATGYNCLCGVDALSEIAASESIDHVAFASAGVSAIKALQTALKQGKDVSLANKESIVVAGPWVMPLVQNKDQLRPVDSEHSAVWQCMREAPRGEIDKIFLTASGGPFREYSLDAMEMIKPKDALKHPVWKMGAKITIDSATLMNKGIECIEAMQLFSLPSEKVDAMIHPKSQVHGMVQFTDGTVKMLLSSADMRLPAAAALGWPNRLNLIERGLGAVSVDDWDLRFTKIDEEKFPCFKLAKEVGKAGGAYPSLLVGADESAVESFLKGEINFTAIHRVVEKTIESWNGMSPASLDEAISLVDVGRRMAEEFCKNWRHNS